jgi:hypothetical protein
MVAKREEGEEDEARLDERGHHQEAGDESHAGVDAVGGGEGGAVGGGAADLFGEFDEVVGYGDLAADVAELGEGAEEEGFFWVEWGVSLGGEWRGEYCFQKEPGSVSPISCSITAMSASVTSGMGAKKKMTCV